MSEQEASGGGQQLFAGSAFSPAESGETAQEPTAEAGESAENVAQQGEEELQPQEQAAQPDAEAELPEKYRNKTAAEIAKMHIEAEKAMHQRAQEAADLKRQFDQFQQMAQQALQQQQPQTPQPQGKQYFHELPYEQQKEAAQVFAQQFGENPLDAVYLLGLNMPFTIDQHLQSSDVLNKMLDSRMQQYFQNAHVQRQQIETQFANHVKQFSEAHPDFNSYQQDIAGVMNELQSKGYMSTMIQNGTDPLDFAYHYVKGVKTPQLQQAAADVAKQNAESAQKERASGFQIGQKPVSKTAPQDDPFGIFRQQTKKGLFQ